MGNSLDKQLEKEKVRQCLTSSIILMVIKITWTIIIRWMINTLRSWEMMGVRGLDFHPVGDFYAIDDTDKESMPMSYPNLICSFTMKKSLRCIIIAMKTLEAKKKIYRIVCKNHVVGFGVEIEAKFSNKLKGMPGVLAVLPDYLIDNCQNVKYSIARFSSTNRNYCLNDIVNYFHLFERNLERNSDNWLVAIRKPDSKFGTEEQTIDFLYSDPS